MSTMERLKNELKKRYNLGETRIAVVDIELRCGSIRGELAKLENDGLVTVENANNITGGTIVLSENFIEKVD